MRVQTGLMEQALIEQFGAPSILSSDAVVQYRWNVNDQYRECVLFKPLHWDDGLKRKCGVLEKIYADVRGGFLLGDSLKVSLLSGPALFGLYSFDDLQLQPEVARAIRADPDICYFMDSANVWFYGLKNGELFVYDSETDEIDSLGLAAKGMKELLTQFLDAE